MSTAPGGIGPIDLRRSAPLRVVEDVLRADDALAVPGEAQIIRGHDGRVSRYLFVCPGCRAFLSFSVTGDTRWDVTGGDIETGRNLTISPSLYHKEPHGCGWHGWLRDGVLVPC